MRVVEEGVVSITPRKRLVADTKVWKGHKLWSSVLSDVLHVFLLLLIGVISDQKNTRYGDEEGYSFPCCSSLCSMCFFLKYHLSECTCFPLATNSQRGLKKSDRAKQSACHFVCTLSNYTNAGNYETVCAIVHVTPSL